jgi:hypothetical protein
MNKPLAIICSVIAGFGVFLLGHCAYLTVAYGQGNPEAGNFHRGIYWSSRDPVTGTIRKDWDRDWNKIGTPEEPAWADLVDMWVVGIGLVVLGMGIYVVERSTGSREHF